MKWLKILLTILITIKYNQKMNLLRIKYLEKCQGLLEEQGGEENGSSFDIKSIIFSLFALIGFIILVYSIFVAVVSESLASIADTVFVAALIGSFTMVGVIVSYSFLKK